MIIFTFGINDRGVARVKPDPSGRPNFDPDGTFAAFGNVDLGGQPFMPLLIYGPQDEQPAADLKFKPTLVFNQISDPDSHQTSLRRCQALCQGLPGVPVINHPDKILENSRDAVSVALAGIDGVRVPRVFRGKPESPQAVFQLAEEAGMDFPFIFRTVGEHNGFNIELLRSVDDIDRLHRFALDGREHYFIEFMDTRDERGVFFKQRVILVDGEPIGRSVIFSDQWMVNSSAATFMRANKDIATFEGLMRDLDERLLPAAGPRFKAMAERLGLDYFGVDCMINDDGEVTVFEANPNMASLSNHMAAKIPETEPRTMEIRARVRAMMDNRTGYRANTLN